MIELQVNDEDEIQYSRLIMGLFEKTAQIGASLETRIDPAEGAPLFLDDARSPHYTVSGYAYGQLTVATGCIASLKQMMVRETDDTVNMIASSFGAYALVRNALDAAATALWLLEPVSGTLRIKRRLLLGVDELNKGNALRQALGEPSTKVDRRIRLQEVAGLAGLGQWDPLREKLPTTTHMLKQLERLHSDGIFPWLAAWQLASGHAHGKLWAQIASNELKEVENTRTETGAQFQMTIRYGMLAALLNEAVQLIITASCRYTELASDSQSRRLS